jgi:broad specificity phosphatase PhoE
MQTLFFVTHPDVVIDPAIPVPDWPLSERGLARMRRALALPWIASIRAVWCSGERKARDGADIIAGHLGLVANTDHTLGENDRSATGYLPRPAFEAMADTFFANPTQSIQGWERAADAQRRIIAAVNRVIARSGGCGGNVAVVSHGGVGTLLLCHLRGEAISRDSDQPPNNGGNYFAFDTQTRCLLHGWQPIDP